MIALSNDISEKLKNMKFSDTESWILTEVIPSILKNGGYIYGQEYLKEQDKNVLIEKVGQLEDAVSKYAVYPIKKNISSTISSPQILQEQEIEDISEEEDLITTL